MCPANGKEALTHRDGTQDGCHLDGLQGAPLDQPRPAGLVPPGESPSRAFGRVEAIGAKRWAFSRAFDTGQPAALGVCTGFLGSMQNSQQMKVALTNGRAPAF